MNLQRYWWPVLPEHILRRQPVARTFFGQPLVLFRDHAGHPTALLDRCPHRHAPLSAGRLVDGTIECPYHGWRFDGSGACQGIPGLDLKAQTKPIVPVFATQVQCGLVWVCIEPKKAPPPRLPSAPSLPVDRFVMMARVQSTIELAAENFLDGFHTHFVHRGWVRRDAQRQRVTATVTPLADGVEARYSGERPQNGLISKLFERERTESAGRFLLPGVAEIEYRDARGLTLIVTVYLTPQTDAELNVHAIVTTRRGIIPARVKQAVLRPLFTRILRQDSEILHLQQMNIRRHAAGSPFLDTRLDLLGPHIRALLAGNVEENNWDIARVVQLSI